MPTDKPLVSVCVITYNHQDYIGQTLDGILRQKTGFPFEIILSDDRSTDNTPDICAKYASRFPQIIRYTRRERNVGIFRNFFETLKEARGEYVAICEGDDYWTDDYKLRKQVSILEEKPECVLTYHNAIVADGKEKKLFINLNNGCRKVGIQSLLWQWLIPTASIMYRNDAFFLPEDCPAFINGDYLLELLLKTKGDFYYDSSIMSVYRYHAGSASEQLNRNRLSLYKGLVDLLTYCKRLYPQEQQKYFDSPIAKYNKEIAGIEKHLRYPFLKYLDWRHYKRKLFKALRIKRENP